MPSVTGGIVIAGTIPEAVDWWWIGRRTVLSPDGRPPTGSEPIGNLPIPVGREPIGKLPILVGREPSGAIPVGEGGASAGAIGPSKSIFWP